MDIFNEKNAMIWILLTFFLFLFIFKGGNLTDLVPKFEGNFAIYTSEKTCVPAQCCHATSCVFSENAPDCSGIACSTSCDPGTMDCGAGTCRYNSAFDSCVVRWNTCGNSICDSNEDPYNCYEDCENINSTLSLSVSPNGIYNISMKRESLNTSEIFIKNYQTNDQGILIIDDIFWYGATIEISKDGYDSYSEKINIEPNETLMKTLTLNETGPECLDGDTQILVCDDNSTIITYGCVNGAWQKTNNECPTAIAEEGGTNEPIIPAVVETIHTEQTKQQPLTELSIVYVLLFVAGLLILTRLTKK